MPASRSGFGRGIESLAKVKAPEWGMSKVGKVIWGPDSTKPRMPVHALENSGTHQEFQKCSPYIVRLFPSIPYIMK